MNVLFLLLALLMLYASAPQDIEENVKAMTAQTQEQTMDFDRIVFSANASENGAREFVVLRTDTGMEISYYYGRWSNDEKREEYLESRKSFDKAEYELFCSVLSDIGFRSWNGFSKRDTDIWDGENWTLSADFGNEHLSASGYEAYPDYFFVFRYLLYDLSEGKLNKEDIESYMAQAGLMAENKKAEPVYFDKFIVRQSIGEQIIEIEFINDNDSYTANYYNYTGKRGKPEQTVLPSAADYEKFCRDLGEFDVLSFSTAKGTPAMKTKREYVYEYVLEYEGKTYTARWTAANRNYCQVYDAAQLIIDDEIYAIE